MASKSLRQELVDDHRKQTKNFSKFMSVLYGTTTILLSIFLIIALSIAYINPLWFRQRMFNYIQYDGPILCRKFQDSLFKSYTDKVNLFDMLKS